MTKRNWFVLFTALGLLLTLTACGKRQDSSARGSVYTVDTYTAAGKTHAAPKSVSMTVYLSSDDKTAGVLSTATLAHAPYYRRYETLVRKQDGSKTKLTTTGEVAALTFSKSSDAKDGINPTQYSYSQKGDATTVGTYTKTATGIDLRMGKTLWHFKRTEKKTRYQLPYGIANQAKNAKVDKGN